jgi:ribosome biogenesis protein Nip4
MKLAISVARPNLISLGTCFGKFSKSGKFKLHITSLDYLAQYAKYKVSLCLYDRCVWKLKKSSGVDKA